jgi:hypothetical protein
MAKFRFLLLMLYQQTKAINQEMCMMVYDDRLDCSLEPINREECIARGCCYDSNVLDQTNTPSCYFPMTSENAQLKEAELNAIPIAITSGTHQVKPSYISVEKSSPPEVDLLALIAKIDAENAEKTNAEIPMKASKVTKVSVSVCKVPVKSMDRCGRRGVPRTRCEEIGCCWNQKWVPGGKYGPRCFKAGSVFDVEHSSFETDEEHTYANGKLERFEKGNSNFGGFLEDKIKEKDEHLEKHKCVANHQNAECIQPLTERLKCDISSDMNEGMEACVACSLRGCCFDPEPKILGGYIQPLCFKKPVQLTTAEPKTTMDFLELIRKLEGEMGPKTTSATTTTTIDPVLQRWNEYKEKFIGVENPDVEIDPVSVPVHDDLTNPNIPHIQFPHIFPGADTNEANLSKYNQLNTQNDYPPFPTQEPVRATNEDRMDLLLRSALFQNL